MDRLRQVVSNRHIRIAITAVVVMLTLGLFGYYLLTHPETLKALFGLSALTILLLTLAYLLTIAANAFVLWASLKLIKKPVHYTENVVLTGYSSIVNFFGPLQSGPGFRAAYLKTKHGVGLKRFFYATLVFYAFFAAINGIVIAVAILSSLQESFLLPISLALLAIGTIGFVVISKRSTVTSSISQITMNNRYFWLIGLGALLLSLATTVAYFIELNHVNSSITVGQTIIYTAAANLALFVSLTPGAIGFRESFLLLSQQLHGISSDIVIAASIIDRAFYVVFLLGLFLLLVASGVRGRFRQSNPIANSKKL